MPPEEGRGKTVSGCPTEMLRPRRSDLWKTLLKTAAGKTTPSTKPADEDRRSTATV